MNELMKQLECPECESYMVPPIFLCEQGHNVCSNCRPKLETCPGCGSQLTEARNVPLETLARNMHYPCMHREDGCVEMFPMEQIAHHEVICPHRPHICPLARVPRVMCPWVGPPLEVQGHVIDTHNQYIAKSNEKAMNKVEFADVTDNFKNYSVVFRDDRVFLRQTEVRDGDFYCAMVFVGPKELARDHLYEVRMQNDDGEIVVRNAACSNEEELDNVYKSTKCVCLHYRVIKNFVSSDDKLILEIGFVEKSNKCCSVM